MNAQKFTQKTIEAIQQAQSLSIEYGNAQTEQAHLLAALLTACLFNVMSTADTTDLPLPAVDRVSDCELTPSPAKELESQSPC